MLPHNFRNLKLCYRLILDLNTRLYPRNKADPLKLCTGDLKIFLGNYSDNAEYHVTGSSKYVCRPRYAIKYIRDRVQYITSNIYIIRI